MKAEAALGLLVLGGLAMWLLWITRSRPKKEEVREVGSEILSVRTAAIVQAFPIKLFSDDVVSIAIDKVTDSLVKKVEAACRKAVRQQKPLQVVINTHGGDTIAGQAINGLLRHLADYGIELRIVVSGKCYSAGVTILMAAEPEYRYAVRGSEFGIHAVRRTNGKRDTGTRMSDKEAVEIIAANSLIERLSLARHMETGHDCVFSADDALKMNVIGGII